MNYFIEGTACCGKTSILNEINTLLLNDNDLKSKISVNYIDFKEITDIYPFFKFKEFNTKLIALYDLYINAKIHAGSSHAMNVFDRSLLSSYVYPLVMDVMEKYGRRIETGVKYLKLNETWDFFINKEKKVFKEMFKNSESRRTAIIIDSDIDTNVCRMWERNNGLDSRIDCYVYYQNYIFGQIAFNFDLPIYDISKTSLSAVRQEIIQDIFCIVKRSENL